MKKLLFLPHCLNQQQKQIIKDKAKEKDYKVHVVGGGSIVKKILSEYNNIDKIIGIACKDELKLAEEYTKSLKNKGTKIKAIILLKDGCKNTQINIEEVIKELK